MITSTNPLFNTAYLYDGVAFTDVEPDFDPPVTIVNATGDQLYLGADLPVNSFEVTVDSPAQIGVFVEYWNGSEWTEISELSDGTFGFTQSGTISFSTPRAESARWKKRTLNGVGPLYWVRITATGQVLEGPVVSGITRNRTGRLYLSNVYCVIGQIHNHIPTIHAQRRWPDGRVELSGTTTPPTTGTWNVGDIIWNSSPSAGGSIGIVCTTAGNGSSLPSPNATWKTFGTIAT